MDVRYAVRHAPTVFELERRTRRLTG
jgi:hypothetical protein